MQNLDLERTPTYAVGHLALGYLTGKATSKLLNTDVKLPLLFLASIISDFDLLIRGLEHRGPTHSAILATLIFIPITIGYGKRALPYFIALIQHSLIGDYLTGGGIQLLWPLKTIFYHGLLLEVTSQVSILLEWIFFLACFTIMLKTKDIWVILQPHSSNLTLFIPVLTVLLPTFISFPLQVPPSLVIPHLAYLIIFISSILTDFKALLERT
jgi:membrane-bound metal-dependent hydrolase YbcI (DUF457 family)